MDNQILLTFNTGVIVAVLIFLLRVSYNAGEIRTKVCTMLAMLEKVERKQEELEREINSVRFNCVSRHRNGLETNR